MSARASSRHADSAGPPAAAQRLRELPAVHVVAADLHKSGLRETIAGELARRAIATVRQRLLDGAHIADAATAVATEADHLAATVRATPLPPVINATGTVLHTGLGRAPLSNRAQAAARSALDGYCQLEFDLDSGRRGDRQGHVAPLLQLLTGAPDALVVNNCAAATVLMLQALARDRQVVVSRGELVEIGGSFRVPEIMAASGCHMVEVGATNKTHPRDYRTAITAETALIMKVHQSNFAQQGFVASVDTAALAEIAHAHDLPLAVDQGSGCLQELPGYRTLASVHDELQAGADLVACSGDKLLGGPQAGILLGRSELIQRCRQHPLARAMRCDKVSLAALAGTLQDHLFDDPRSAIPTLHMLLGDPELSHIRAQRILEQAGPLPGTELVATRGAVGSGALPTEGPASHAIAITTGDPDRLHQALRLGEPAIVGRIHEGRLLLDCATVFDDQVADLADRLRSLLTP